MARPHGYLRKSVTRRGQETLSPETQEAEVRRLAAHPQRQRRATVIEADWHISGRRQFTENRPGYQRLLAAIRFGECSAVYSYSQSRLSRATLVLKEFIELCQSRGHRDPVRRR